jgi:hypothetical protein
MDAKVDGPNECGSLIEFHCGCDVKGATGGHFDYSLWVANLTDIIASKRAAGRARDKAVLNILEKTLLEKSKS